MRTQKAHNRLHGPISYWVFLIQTCPCKRISEFLEVRLRTPILKNKYLVYWELDSDISKKFKEGYAQGLRREQRAKRKPPVSPVNERIEPLLKCIEGGDIEQWFALTHHLWIDTDTGQVKHQGQIDLRESPGWKALDETFQVRVEQAGIRFIINYCPPPDEWFGKVSWSFHVLSVCMALLILTKQLDVVDQIESREWSKWIPYMVDNPVFFNNGTSHSRLFSVAYKKAPEITKEYLSRLMKSEDRGGQGIYCLNILRPAGTLTSRSLW